MPTGVLTGDIWLNNVSLSIRQSVFWGSLSIWISNWLISGCWLPDSLTISNTGVLPDARQDCSKWMPSSSVIPSSWRRRAECCSLNSFLNKGCSREVIWRTPMQSVDHLNDGILSGILRRKKYPRNLCLKAGYNSQSDIAYVTCEAISNPGYHNGNQ